MTRDYNQIVRSIYITSDQVAIVCFHTQDTLLQQTVQERYKVGLVSTLYSPTNPAVRFDVGYNSARSQVQDEVLQDMAHATVLSQAPQKLIHFDYFFLNPAWRCDIQTRMSELPSTQELDELANML